MLDGTVMSKPARETDALLQVGVITGAHGVRGLVRVKSYTDDPSDLTAYGGLTGADGATRYALDIRGEAKGQFLVKLDGVDDRNAAEALKGEGLFIAKDALPALDPDGDDFYHADLIGLRVESDDGAPYGVVTAVHDFGAGPLLQLRLSDGGEEIAAFTKDVFPTVDLAHGCIVIDPPTTVAAETETEAEAGQ